MMMVMVMMMMMMIMTMKKKKEKKKKKKKKKKKNLRRGSIDCRGQGSLKAESLQSNTLHGECTNDNDDDNRNATASLLKVIKLLAPKYFFCS